MRINNRIFGGGLDKIVTGEPLMHVVFWLSVIIRENDVLSCVGFPDSIRLNSDGAYSKVCRVCIE